VIIDPRDQRVFDTSSPHAYLSDYARSLQNALMSVDGNAMEEAAEAVQQAARLGSRIHSIGNGGSAAVADHLACDWMKGIHVPGEDVIFAESMTGNIALYSAIANDFTFEEVFSKQVEFLGRENDVLVAISSSGNSPNILGAVEKARSMGLVTIGMSGFDGGKLRPAVDISLHVAVNNYGVVEDAHQSLMHVLAQYIHSTR
jgi:D-sedoheptulose 7-phosphate isomerase